MAQGRATPSVCCPFTHAAQLAHAGRNQIREKARRLTGW